MAMDRTRYCRPGCPVTDLACRPPKKKPRQENLPGLTAGKLHLPSGLAGREMNVPDAWKQEIASVVSRLAAELPDRLVAGHQTDALRLRRRGLDFKRSDALLPLRPQLSDWR